MRRHATILLTGFGPFPGVAENASALLAPKLAHLVARRFRAHRVVARVLPTEWEAAAVRLVAHYTREKPALALHFGVSERAQGFVIETLARNACAPLPDAVGALPRASHVVDRGPETRSATLPFEAILARLAAIGVPATLSDDAGAYLCNATLYRALGLTQETSEAVVGFVHVPVTLERRTSGNAKPHLDWESALLGGLEIVRACLGRPLPSRRREALALKAR